MGRSTDVASAYGTAAVTPNDSTIIPTTRGLSIGVGGNVAVRFGNGSIATIAVLDGITPFQVDRVYATGTTATGIFALY